MTNAMSIDNNIYQGRLASSQKAQFLEQRLEAIDDKQGFLGSIWNGIKEVTTLGVSQSDCESMLDKYKNGEISFEEAVIYLDEFDSKQETMSNLLSNIITGVGAIAAVGATGPVGWATAFMTGAPIGALLKTGIRFADRATNDIEGDALDGKQMTKDAISGAITGAASAVSGSECFIFKGLEAHGLLPANQLATSALKGALCGVECGAIAGSANYMTDVAFGDKEFSFGDLTNTAVTSAFVSGTVGGVVGATAYGLDVNNLAQTVTSKGQILKDSILSSTRKVGGEIEKDMLDI